MTDGYNKERTAALVKEAQEITAHLKIEAKEIETQMGKVFDDEHGSLDVPAGEQVGDGADFWKETPPKFLWRFWR